MPEDSGRVAIVTGGSRGIGLAIVQALLARGDRVCVVDVNERELANLAANCGERAEGVLGRVASVIDRDAIRGVVTELVAEWGSVDILVNNAGLNRPGGLFEQKDDDWDAVMAVNVKGAFVCSGEAARAMRNRGYGRIVSIGSTAAAGGEGAPAYAASKAALIGLTRTIASELGQFGITANLVAPGITLTGWVERNLPEANLKSAADAAPTRRVGTPEDVASTVAFLCSDEARQVTGQLVSVSGGAWMP